MKTKITQSIVTNMQAAAKDIVLYDDALPGFCLRIRPTGTKIWYYRYRTTGGPQRRLVLGRFPGVGAAMARQLAMVAAGDVARGIDLLAQRREVAAETVRSRQSTLKTFITERYEPWALTYLRTGEFQLERIRADFAGWMDKPLTDLTPWLIDQWRKRQIAAGMAPVTVNRNLQRLRALVAKAVLWKVIDLHPFAEVKPLRCDRTGRARYLSDAEEQQLRDALFAREQKLRRNRVSFNKWLQQRGFAPFPLRTAEFIDHIRPMVLIALNTGMRRGELLNLQWRDVDLDGKWLMIQGATAKSGQTRRIPLNVEALAIISGWKQQAGRVRDDGYVFRGATGAKLTRIDTAWRKLVKRANLENFRFHDLRHHFASRLVQSGIDLNTVRDLMGHADLEMVLRYAHLSPDRLTMAVEKVARSAPAPSAAVPA